jgi:restriction system protein
MNDVTLPTRHDLLWPTLAALKELGGSGTVDEILCKIVELEAFTEEQQSVPHGDGPTSEIAYRAAWARTYLKKVGAINNDKPGVWAITKKGRRLKEADVAAIPRQVHARYRQDREAKESQSSGS